ncbi:unnamed protein product [Bursaphelenchus okinawaensis]|uniref:Uncharacterized protein n=1 Tax=Bursaphelenchus okinawaensis TaxID=465554 RepID=A0A811LM46_9BILA|nr:unnamed protein product [Bursaphelenchus okinawaensis]CAG9124612.1 unnamed protein product [Bursaphelenchus okinawaensis]
MLLYCFHDILYGFAFSTVRLTLNLKKDYVLIGIRSWNQTRLQVVYAIVFYAYCLFMHMFMLVVNCYCRFSLINGAPRYRWLYCYLLTNILSLFIAVSVALTYDIKHIKYELLQDTCFESDVKNIIISDTSIVPIITSTGPVVLVSVSIVLNLDFKFGELTLMGVVCWIPLVNNLSAIILIKPYRERVSHLFFTLSGKKGSTSTVSNVRNNID